MSRQYVQLSSAKIIFDGNSITEGSGSGAGAANISSQVAAQLIAQKIFGASIVNLGVGGQTCAQMIADGSSQVAPLLEAGRDCIMVVNEGGNDIYFGATAQQAYQNMRDYCLLRRSEGFYVLVWSCPNRNNGFSADPGGSPVAYQAALLDFNNRLERGWKEFADAFMDARRHFPYAPEANFPGNGGFWFPDCVHPSATGNAIIAAKLIEHLKLIPKQSRKVKDVPINNPTIETEFFWDALALPTTTGEFIATLTSGGSVVSTVINVNGRPGILTLSTLVAATGRAFVGTDRAAIELSGGETIFGGSTQIPVLSTAAERFQLLIGFFDTATAVNQTDGLYFLYDEGGASVGSTASTNWQLVSCSNGVRFFVATTFPVDTNWTNFKIILNSAGTRADYYINGQLAGSLAANLPIGGNARSLGLGTMIIKSIGTTARTVLLDWLYFKQILKVARGAW
jgi:lysophospholipase L1-like esterase